LSWLVSAGSAFSDPAVDVEQASGKDRCH
jgi:hypothetical protein